MPNRRFGGALSYRNTYADIRLIAQKQGIVGGSSVPWPVNRLLDELPIRTFFYLPAC